MILEADELNGKESYQAGVRLWLADDAPAAIATFRAGTLSSDQRYRYLCQGFVHYLTARRDESLLAALQEFADAELLGFLDFSMLFVVGHIAWQLAERPIIDDELGKAVLLQLAQRAYHAVQVEMPKPMLMALERQYDLSVGYLAEQLQQRLVTVERWSPAAADLLARLAYPECNLAALVEDLGLGQSSAELCLVDRLLATCAYMSKRLLLGKPADLEQVLAAT